MTNAAAAVDAVGQVACRNAVAIVRLMAPAASPLIQASQVASSSETFRVRLLSIAQARQAARISSVGARSPTLACGVHDSTTAPPAIAIIPSAILRSTFSRKTIQASNAVNTPSALRSN